MSQAMTRPPRFNHVAMSVPADLLGADGRAEILAFWNGVFGFEELPSETIDRQVLVLSAYDWEQFLFLIADDDPMACPRLDHFGMSVSSLDELEAFLAKAKAFAEHDDRVDIIDQKAEVHGDALTLHSFYVRYLLPMMIEIQFFDWDPSVAALNPTNQPA
ncbi:MAG: hypothetical protein ABWZ14_02825 [Acidimicrobiales bacterium]